MLLQKEREEIVRFGKKLITSRLTTGSGGNLSLINRQEGLVAVSPSGLEYLDIQPKDVVIVDIDGEIVEGKRKPTSELSFHLALYHKRSDIQAIVHTHSVYATTMACLNWEIPAVHYLVGFSGKKVPLASYATFGTEGLARNITESIGNYNAVLLANHGLVTVGPDIFAAFCAAEEIELVAQIYYQSKCIGDPVILSEEEMKRVTEKFKTYGQKGADSKI
jgi:L-fuculose-phosphate aldolase